MNAFERGVAAHMGEAALAGLQQVKVGIAGAGGLGSNCAVNLVRSGFRRLVIADFDRVENSNLNRQFFFGSQVGKPKVAMLAENLLAINPDLVLEVHDIRIAEENLSELFGTCDAVVEAFDTPAAKQMIVARYMQSEKLLVAASGISGWGDTDRIRIRKIRENFYLVGDMVSAAGKECPPLSPGVTIAAAKQADVVLSHFLCAAKKY